MLSETRRNGGGEREIGAGFGGAEAEGAGVATIRGQHREGHLEHDRAVRSGIETSAATRRRSAETEEGTEYTGSPVDGKVAQFGAADPTAASAR